MDRRGELAAGRPTRRFTAAACASPARGRLRRAGEATPASADLRVSRASDLFQRVREQYDSLVPPAERKPVTRFAPSPTGELHLGHVLHAVWVWRVAREMGATVLIRMEDHDRARCRPAYERAILADLEWLGFEPDAASRASLDAHPSPFRQSDHPERYAEAFERLRSATDVYGCTCTRAMMEAVGVDGERRYAGTCRGSPIDREGKHVVRAELPDEETRIEDLQRGPLVQRPQREQGDVAVRDALGQWTYQFCVAVDDLHDGVNLIVRGDDLASSTGRQWLLARMLGRSEPCVTVHHPLLYAADGRKLSKRDRSETVRAMRERGMTAAEIVAAASGGVG